MILFSEMKFRETLGGGVEQESTPPPDLPKALHLNHYLYKLELCIISKVENIFTAFVFCFTHVGVEFAITRICT